ncbi:ubiquitin C-terminal hydrolase 13-like [Macadamia integrifolia]|uniref:ubiquitin C-terminal hydrolase 13-like n=1 Tax=Macadamia integrifolia TaxID=60698 RepID=UPI001C52C4C2|nr:ubiquitin C-terminal hydrolase 13-like [Macadamia integrifolia]
MIPHVHASHASLTRGGLYLLIPYAVRRRSLLIHQLYFRSSPQAMEVEQADTAGMVENQSVEDPSSSKVTITWEIKRFSSLKLSKLKKEHYSDILSIGGYKWRVVICLNKADYLSLYLYVANSEDLPYRWSRWTKFSLAVINQSDRKRTVKYETQCLFNAQKTKCGFPWFMLLSEICDTDGGYNVENTVKVEVEVAVKAIDYLSYDSKKETGYVGFENHENQTAPHYMNSLLQTLYHIPKFRKAVYNIPTILNAMPSWSIPRVLQSLFYMLQYSNNSVVTRRLYHSLDWDTDVQHDALQHSMSICGSLENKMKGTAMEGSIRWLFEGYSTSYIKCINVDLRVNEVESFLGLRIDVGCQDVYAFFDKYVKDERLEGDNKYMTVRHGPQDATKKVLFKSFPPVLQLQLNWFEYDSCGYHIGKRNGRFEYPLILDLDRDNGKYLSPEADQTVRNLYTLHSVLVCGDGVGDEHNYAFIRPTLSDQWFKFYDERVTKEDMSRALEEQYGGEEKANPGFSNTPFEFSRYSCAYMLVYIRESDKEEIFCDVAEEDMAEILKIRLKKEKEQEEKEHRKREKEEAHLYTVIKVARNEDLIEQIGRDVYYGLVDHDKVQSFHIQNSTPFFFFKEQFARDNGFAVEFLCFWLWTKGRNGTYGPRKRLTCFDENKSVAKLRKLSNRMHNGELKLFFEVKLVPVPTYFLVTDLSKGEDDILLFFKLYCPERKEFRYVGKLSVKAMGKPVDILTELNEMACFDPYQEIVLYKEIEFKCEDIDNELTFRSSQIENGDIICFQKKFKPAVYGIHEHVPSCPTVRSFLENVHYRQVVYFQCLDKPNGKAFFLELSKLSTYDITVRRVAQFIGLDDPYKIRLTIQNCLSEQPFSVPIDHQRVKHLSDMLVYSGHASDMLYYEVLATPLPKLNDLKTLKFAFHSTVKDKVVFHSVTLPKRYRVADLFCHLIDKVKLCHSNARLRLLDVSDHKISVIFHLWEEIGDIDDKQLLRVEEIPEEERNCGPQDCLIHVFHFRKDTSQFLMYFGDPFCLIIHEGETLAKIKLRIQKKLQVPDDKFVKWKFAVVQFNRPKYLEDSAIVSSYFQDGRTRGVSKPHLGLERPFSDFIMSLAPNKNRITCEIVEGVEPSKGADDRRFTSGGAKRRRISATGRS